MKIDKSDKYYFIIKDMLLQSSSLLSLKLANALSKAKTKFMGHDHNNNPIVDINRKREIENVAKAYGELSAFIDVLCGAGYLDRNIVYEYAGKMRSQIDERIEREKEMYDGLLETLEGESRD